MSAAGTPTTQTVEGMTWTSPDGDISIWIERLHTGIFQMHQKSHGGGPKDIVPYPTLAEARIEARMRAELILMIQKGA